MIELLQYGFMQNALITGTLIAITLSTLGVFLVLRRYALLGDGLAHLSFGGVAAGFLFGLKPLLSATIFAVLGSLGILKLVEKTKIHGDAAIGILSQTSMGIGIFIISITQGVNVDIMSYLFGSILAITKTETITALILTLLALTFIILNYKKLLAMTFDEESAKISGVNTQQLNTMLMILTAITIAISMRITGLLLVSSLIIIPAVTATQIAKSFKQTLIFAGIISTTSVITGIITSYYIDAATSGTIILVTFLIFSTILVCKKIKKISKKNT
ncbi:metal ABC transporter permease [Candidatus Woesearchaeota archaeon]|nr:metal ABC transporter permease [Candidatus Woesearchaeota archaeon]